MKNISLERRPGWAAEAIALQQELRGKVVLESAFRRLADIRIIAGVDVSHDTKGYSHAAIVMLDAKTLEPLEELRVSRPTLLPYVPGLLSFREVPVILDALSELKKSPALLMVDGNGIIHPRRFGLAAHLGVVTGLPAMGVAKSKLTGTHAAPGSTKGAHAPLTDKGERIGTVLRSRDGCKPVFVSPGYKVSQQQALALTLHCLTRYRMPEPTRLADRLSKTP